MRRDSRVGETRVAEIVDLGDRPRELALDAARGVVEDALETVFLGRVSTIERRQMEVDDWGTVCEVLLTYLGWTSGSQMV